MIESGLAGCCAALAVYLWRADADMGGRLASSEDENVQISLVVLLEMITVALRQGASITYAFEVIGSVVSGRFGSGLRRVASALKQGVSWSDAWLSMGGSTPDETPGGWSRRLLAATGFAIGSTEAEDGRRCAEDDGFAIIEETLKDSWTFGAPPTNRLESTMEQIDANQKAAIDQAASKLSIDLLTPTALCFLPAFMLIGVIPCIGSFMH